MQLVFIVYGDNVSIEVDPTAPLATAVEAALVLSRSTGRPAGDWDIRDALGTYLDPTRPVEKFGFKDGTRLFLSLRVAAGGAAVHNEDVVRYLVGSYTGRPPVLDEDRVRALLTRYPDDPEVRAVVIEILATRIEVETWREIDADLRTRFDVPHGRAIRDVIAARIRDLETPMMAWWRTAVTASGRWITLGRAALGQVFGARA